MSVIKYMYMYIYTYVQVHHVHTYSLALPATTWDHYYQYKIHPTNPCHRSYCLQYHEIQDRDPAVSENSHISVCMYIIIHAHKFFYAQ